MNDITPKEASEILSHYTNLGYGIVIEGEDTSKIKQALSLASKKLVNGTSLHINVPSANCISRKDKWGKWIISEIRCPECLDYFDTDCYSTEELKKCPCCGATMKGGA